MKKNIEPVIQALFNFFVSAEDLKEKLDNLIVESDTYNNDFIYDILSHERENPDWCITSSKADIFIQYCMDLINKYDYKPTKKDLEAIDKSLMSSPNRLSVDFMIAACKNHNRKELLFFTKILLFTPDELCHLATNATEAKTSNFIFFVTISIQIRKLVHIFDIENTKHAGWQVVAIRRLLQDFQSYLIDQNEFSLIGEKARVMLEENKRNNIRFSQTEKEKIFQVLTNGESIGFCLKLRTDTLENHALGLYSYGSYLIVSNSGYTHEEEPYTKVYQVELWKKLDFFEELLSKPFSSVQEFEEKVKASFKEKPIFLNCIKQEGGTCTWMAMQNNLFGLFVLAAIQQSSSNDNLTRELLTTASEKAAKTFSCLYASFCLDLLYRIIVVDKETSAFLLKNHETNKIIMGCYEKIHGEKNIGGSDNFKKTLILREIMRYTSYNSDIRNFFAHRLFSNDSNSQTLIFSETLFLARLALLPKNDWLSFSQNTLLAWQPRSIVLKQNAANDRALIAAKHKI